MINVQIFAVFLLIAAFFVVRTLAFAENVAIDADSTTKEAHNRVDSFIADQLAKGLTPNRLINQRSPYLLQHAFNPVDWHAWGPEAFAKAREEGKPIFLSIGYSTCHWCHVMARESFENPEIAAILNRYFISIKVDREERPDLDHIYMTVTQMISGSGGWPMSVFLTPELKPFYAGTYFPPRANYGRPGFIDLLTAIEQNWRQDRHKITDSADKITAHLRDLAGPGNQTGAFHYEKTATKAFNDLFKIYDSQEGGFGQAPKFPRPVIFNFLLRYFHKNNEKQALNMVAHSLKKMADGGMHDHLGGGFHRYSVDGKWLVPHFEKMLYDQAQLAISYLDVYQITRDRFFAEVAGRTLDYVLGEMTDKEGGFYSAEDADSALPENPELHGEGTFYIWPQKEIVTVLGEENAKIFNYHYGVQPNGNVLDDPQKEFAGKNILHQARELKDTALKFKSTETEVVKILADCRTKLLKARNSRPRPHLDDKILVSWNGLMISALAGGYQVLGEERYLAAAQKAADFILHKMYEPDKETLYHRFRADHAGLEAHLADFSFLVQGLLDLYEASFEPRRLAEAIVLTDIQIKLFYDKEHGGFFETSGKDASILVRMKEDYDSAEPAANSVAALNLIRLSHLSGNNERLEQAKRTTAAFADQINAAPTAMPQMLVASDALHATPLQIIFTGGHDSKERQEMITALNKKYLPDKILVAVGTAEEQKYLGGLMPFVAELDISKAAAYVCENFVCKLPANTAQELTDRLDGKI